MNLYAYIDRKEIIGGIDRLKGPIIWVYSKLLLYKMILYLIYKENTIINNVF